MVKYISTKFKCFPIFDSLTTIILNEQKSYKFCDHNYSMHTNMKQILTKYKHYCKQNCLMACHDQYFLINEIKVNKFMH